MTAATTPQPLALVDVEDLEVGDLAALIAEVGGPPVNARRAVVVSSAARRAWLDAAVAARTVVGDGSAAVQAHHLGAHAAALVA